MKTVSSKFTKIRKCVFKIHITLINMSHNCVFKLTYKINFSVVIYNDNEEESGDMIIITISPIT